MNIERIGLVMLAGLALGSSVVMTRLGISEIPPLFLVTLRLAVATLGFAVTLVVVRRELPPAWRTRLDIAIVGITNMGIPLVAFTLALQFISSGVLAILLALIPIFTGLMAHGVLAQERLNRFKVIGLVAAFGGVLLLLMTRTTGLAGSAAGTDIRGYALALGGGLSVAFAAVYTRLRLRETDVLIVAAGQMATGLLAVAPLALIWNTLDLAAVSWRGWLAVGYSGMIGSFLAFLLFFHMIKRFGATTAALPGYVLPLVSAGLGVLMLGEVVNRSLLAGASLTLLGVFIASR